MNEHSERPPLLRMHGAVWASIASVVIVVSAMTSAAFWAGSYSASDSGLGVRVSALEAKLDHVSDAVQTKLDSLNDKLTDVDVSIARIEGDRRVPPRSP